MCNFGIITSLIEDLPSEVDGIIVPASSNALETAPPNSVEVDEIIAPGNGREDADFVTKHPLAARPTRRNGRRHSRDEIDSQLIRSECEEEEPRHVLSLVDMGIHRHNGDPDDAVVQSCCLFPRRSCYLQKICVEFFRAVDYEPEKVEGILNEGE